MCSAEERSSAKAPRKVLFQMFKAQNVASVVSNEYRGSGERWCQRGLKKEVPSLLLLRL